MVLDPKAEKWKRRGVWRPQKSQLIPFGNGRVSPTHAKPEKKRTGLR